MTVALAIDRLLDVIRGHTDASVFLGLPDDTIPGVYVWPWLIEEDAHAQNQWRSQIKPGGVPERTVTPQTVSVLIFVRPALTPVGLALLDSIRLAVHDSFVSSAGEEPVRLQLRPLSLDQMSNLFMAAQLPLTVCLSVALGPVN